MKIAVNAKMLNQILKDTKPYINFKNKFPILETVKISAKNNDITITGTNLNDSIISRLSGSVTEEGEVCIDIKELMSIVKNQKDRIVINDDTIENGITINYKSLDAEEYPVINELVDYEEYKITNETINGISLCLPYVLLNDDSRPTFNQVWIDNENIFACDTHKLLIIKNDEIKQENKDNAIPIPYNSTKLISNTFKNSKQLTLKVSKNNLVEISDQLDQLTTVICRMPNVKPFPYKQVIPREFVNKITVNTKEFKSILDKIPEEKIKEKIIKNGETKEGKKDIIVTKLFLNLQCDNVKVDTKLVKEFDLSCDSYIWKPMLVAFYKPYMEKFVDTFKADKQITINFSGVGSPASIQNDKMLALLVPTKNERN